MKHNFNKLLQEIVNEGVTKKAIMKNAPCTEHALKSVKAGNDPSHTLGQYLIDLHQRLKG